MENYSNSEEEFYNIINKSLKEIQEALKNDTLRFIKITTDFVTRYNFIVEHMPMNEQKEEEVFEELKELESPDSTLSGNNKHLLIGWCTECGKLINNGKETCDDCLN